MKQERTIGAGRVAVLILAATLMVGGVTAAGAQEPVRRFQVALASRPHHVAPTSDGALWYTAQLQGALGRLDPATGETEIIALGEGSKPRGVLVGPDGGLWITDSGLDAILRLDPESRELERFDLPGRRGPVNLYGAAFDGEGRLWFTGQAGVYGRLDPATGEITVSTAPRGPGPTSMTTTPEGEVYFTSYNGNYLARIDPATGKAAIIEPPAKARPDAGSGRSLGAGASQRLPRADDWPVGPLGVAADSRGRIWLALRDAGNLARYDPADESWEEWGLPGSGSAPYGLWIDADDRVWLSDVGAGGIFWFDPESERFQRRRDVGSTARIYHLHGRPGEVWAADNHSDQIVLVPTR